MFDVMGRTTFYLEGQDHNNVYTKFIGHLHRLFYHETKGPMIEFKHGMAETIKQTKLRQKIFILNQIPPGMFFFGMDDQDFGRNAHKYWKVIQSSGVQGWWWTANLQPRYKPRQMSDFGFVFQREDDAILYSQLLGNKLL